MTYVIAETCINVKDKACVEVCPVDCIYEGETMLYIHPDECIDCGACEPVCPVKAIFVDDELPAEWKQYTEINKQKYERQRDGQPCAAARRSRPQAPSRDFEAAAGREQYGGIHEEQRRQLEMRPIGRTAFAHHQSARERGEGHGDRCDPNDHSGLRRDRCGARRSSSRHGAGSGSGDACMT